MFSTIKFTKRCQRPKRILLNINYVIGKCFEAERGNKRLFGFFLSISDVHRFGVRFVHRRHGVSAVVPRVRILLRLSERVLVQQSVRRVPETSRSHSRRRAQQPVQNDRLESEKLERKRPRSLEIAARCLVQICYVRVSERHAAKP